MVGFLVRGFFPNPAMQKLAVDSDDFINALAQDHQRSERRMNFVAAALITAFLFALYHFWNIGLVIAAVIIMAARVPDLIWEIKHGSKLRLIDMRRPRFYILSTVLSWVSLPVVWYALYRM
ncbi:MAG: hypothetical protein ACJ8FR_00735 [Sphingomonas sp.]